MHGKYSRQNASDIAIEHSVLRPVSDAHNRRSGIVADTRKRKRILFIARKNSSMLRDDFLRRLLQIARAAVIAKPGPQPQHFFLRRRSQSMNIRKPRKKSRVVRNDRS